MLLGPGTKENNRFNMSEIGGHIDLTCYFLLLPFVGVREG